MPDLLILSNVSHFLIYNNKTNKNMGLEFTGDYYKCESCSHIWDYLDDRCPECGNTDTSDIPTIEVFAEMYKQKDRVEKKRLLNMLDSHDETNICLQTGQKCGFPCFGDCPDYKSNCD